MNLRRYAAPRFWVPIAAISGLLALLVMAIYWPGLSQHKLAGDFFAYREAAGRVYAGADLYFARQLSGPYPAVTGEPNYLYPPPFAALMGWSLLLPGPIGSWLWLILSVAAAVLGVALALRSAGLAPKRAVVVAIAATAWFGPTWHMVMLGNVSGLLTLSVGAMLFAGPRLTGAALAVAALLKVTPLALGPALLLARPRMVITGLAVGAAVLLPSLVLQWQDWLDFPIALINLGRGSAVFDTNFAPAAVLAAHFGLTGLASLTRLVVIAVCIGLVGLSFIWSRRPAGVAGALAAATAVSLYLPGSFWYHYALVLLPFVAVAYLRARSRLRTALLATCAGISASWLLVANPLTALLLLFLVAELIIALRPREDRP